jgi:hypothetical protein
VDLLGAVEHGGIPRRSLELFRRMGQRQKGLDLFQRLASLPAGDYPLLFIKAWLFWSGRFSTEVICKSQEAGKRARSIPLESKKLFI